VVDIEEVYQQAVLENPKSAWSYIKLAELLYAWLYIRLGRLDSAIEDLRHAIYLEPDFSKWHYLLGETLAKTGDLSGERAEPA